MDVIWRVITIDLRIWSGEIVKPSRLLKRAVLLRRSRYGWTIFVWRGLRRHNSFKSQHLHLF